jgi:hypothetical protein
MAFCEVNGERFLWKRFPEPFPHPLRIRYFRNRAEKIGYLHEFAYLLHNYEFDTVEIFYPPVYNKINLFLRGTCHERGQGTKFLILQQSIMAHGSTERMPSI